MSFARSVSLTVKLHLKADVIVATEKFPSHDLDARITKIADFIGCVVLAVNKNKCSHNGQVRIDFGDPKIRWAANVPGQSAPKLDVQILCSNCGMPLVWVQAKQLMDIAEEIRQLEDMVYFHDGD